MKKSATVSKLVGVEAYVAESIEHKVRRIVNNKEPIKEKEMELNNQTGGKFLDASSQLVRREEHNPFTVVTMEGKGSFVSFGNFKLTEITTKERCIEMIETRDWGLIASWTLLLISANKSLITRFNEEADQDR